MSGREGLVLAAHGARDDRTVDAVRAQVGLVADRLPDAAVEAGFLEFIRPTIGEAIGRVIERELSEVSVVPLFLAAGAHVGRDIPAVVAEARTDRPDVALRRTPHVGCQPAMVDMAAELVARTAGPIMNKQRAGLILLAHGSRRDEAIVETRAFTERVRRRLGLPCATTAFLAMGRPRADAALRQAVEWPVDRIVIYGHFLFPGRMMDTVDQLVEAAADAHPNKKWDLAGPLGPAESIAEMVVQLHCAHSADR